MSKKTNLVLVHSFGTNSVILKHLEEYLDTYFNVYFVDLPGHSRKQRRLDKVSLSSYYEFLEEKIRSFRLKDYVIGGISFGFLVVNNTKLDESCRGILAIEPYTDSRALQLNGPTRLFLLSAINAILFLKLEKRFWKTRFFASTLERLKTPKSMIPQMIREIDPTTFLETGRLILLNKKRLVFQDKPYVLIVNSEDDTVSVDYLTSLFAKHTRKHLVLSTDIDHYPEDMSYKYFERMLPENLLADIEHFTSPIL